jgi:hypothetical protein
VVLSGLLIYLLTIAIVFLHYPDSSHSWSLMEKASNLPSCWKPGVWDSLLNKSISIDSFNLLSLYLLEIS